MYVIKNRGPAMAPILGAQGSVVAYQKRWNVETNVFNKEQPSME